MSNGYQPNSKKQTAYNGPAPNSGQGTVYGGPTVRTSEGTVYNGPAVPPRGGTVYNGPPAAAYNGQGAGTVYQGPSAFGTNAPSTGYSRYKPVATVNDGARKGAGVFYWIAGVTALRTLLLFLGVQQLTLGANRMAAGDPQSILMINAVIIGIFVALGVFTGRGSKIALMIGMGLYGLDTVLLLLGNAAANGIYILIHALFLYSLFKAYRQFAD